MWRNAMPGAYRCMKYVIRSCPGWTFRNATTTPCHNDTNAFTWISLRNILPLPGLKCIISNCDYFQKVVAITFKKYRNIFSDFCSIAFVSSGHFLNRSENQCPNLPKYVHSSCTTDIKLSQSAHTTTWLLSYMAPSLLAKVYSKNVDEWVSFFRNGKGRYVWWHAEAL